MTAVMITLSTVFLLMVFWSSFQLRVHRKRGKSIIYNHAHECYRVLLLMLFILSPLSAVLGCKTIFCLAEIVSSGARIGCRN